MDNPADPGGATFKGVTLATFRNYKKASSATVEELKEISQEDLKGIYSIYWNNTRCDEVSKGVDLCLFDWAVNSGIYVPIKKLQTILGVVSDGVFGVHTMAALHGTEPVGIITAMKRSRAAFYDSLIKQRPQLGVFRKGWYRRVNCVYSSAMAMAKAG